MSISDKLDYLAGTKEQIRQAIISKGIPVSDSDTFRSYAAKILLIEGGGGVVPVSARFWRLRRTYSPSTSFVGLMGYCLMGNSHRQGRRFSALNSTPRAIFRLPRLSGMIAICGQQPVGRLKERI